MLAPIILFVYNRKAHTIRTVDALLKNELAKDSILYVFCDGPKDNASEEQILKVREVQEYVKTIVGFKDIHIKINAYNNGLANSVIAGVTNVLDEYGKAIVVEDDIITHPYFLRYMNDCLDVFKDRQDIFMIGGYNYNFRMPNDYIDDVYVVHRSCTWGWATWKNRWDKADWSVGDYDLMCNDKGLQKKFNRGGEDMFPMLKSQMNGEIDSWGIRWDYCMYKHDGLCVHPVKGLCSNSGFDGSGIHCENTVNETSAPLYDKRNYEIKINRDVLEDNVIAKRFALYQKYSTDNSYRVCMKEIKGMLLQIKLKLFNLKFMIGHK